MRIRDLVEFGPQVVFRHPLVCSVVYHATPLSQQRRIHRALAAAGDAGSIRIGSSGIRGWLRAGLMTRWRHGWSRAAEHASAAGTRPRRRSCPMRLSCRWTSACAPRGCSRQPKRSSPASSLDRAGARLDRAQAGPATLARDDCTTHAAGLLGARYAQAAPRQPAGR